MDLYKFYSRLQSDLWHEFKNTDFASDQDRRLHLIKIKFIDLQLLRIRCPYTLTAQDETVLEALYHRFHLFIDALGEPHYHCLCPEHKSRKTLLDFGRSTQSDILFKSVLHNISVQIMNYEEKGYCPRYHYNKQNGKEARYRNAQYYDCYSSEEDNFEDQSDHQAYARNFCGGKAQYKCTPNYSSDEEYSDQEDFDYSEQKGSTHTESQSKRSATIEDIRNLIKGALQDEDNNHVIIPLPWRDAINEVIPLPWEPHCHPIQIDSELQNIFIEQKDSPINVEDTTAIPNIRLNLEEEIFRENVKAEIKVYDNEVATIQNGEIGRTHVATLPLDMDRSKNATIFDRLLHIVRNRRHDVMWWNTRFKFLVTMFSSK